MSIDHDSIFPKYYQIKEYLLKYFQEKRLKQGDKIPSENILVKHFNVSRNTVRQAIDTLENEGIVYRIQGKGTFFNTAEQKKNYLIGVITPVSMKYIYLDIINGIEEYAHEMKYQILLSNSNADTEKEKEALESMLTKGIAGLIIEPALSSSITPDSYIFKTLNGLKIPVVLIDCRVDLLKFPSITLDDIQCGFLAAEYLISMNHRRIAMVYDNDTIAGGLRCRGYINALTRHQIEIDPSLIIEFSGTKKIPLQEGDKDLMPAEYYTRRLLTLNNPPTAIFYFNDESALSGIQVIQKSGLQVPDDISVLGFDDSQYAKFAPVPLTTFVHPKKEMGLMAAKILIEAIESPGKNPNLIYPIQTRLVERKSVKKLN